MKEYLINSYVYNWMLYLLLTILSNYLVGFLLSLLIMLVIYCLKIYDLLLYILLIFKNYLSLYKLLLFYTHLKIFQISYVFLMIRLKIQMPMEILFLYMGMYNAQQNLLQMLFYLFQVDHIRVYFLLVHSHHLLFAMFKLNL